MSDNVRRYAGVLAVWVATLAALWWFQSAFT